MKVLKVNKYLYLRGGSEYVLFDTVRLLEARGHETVFFSMRHPDNFPSKFEKYFVSNVDYESASPLRKVSAALRLLYSFEAERGMARLLRDERPDVAHLHNIYHQMTPSILRSLRRAKVPVVMTLHDLKLVCPAYTMDRGGKLCVACAGGRYYNCAAHSCFKGSKAKSLLAAAEMYLHHSVLRLYDLVDVFICPSLFLKERIEGMGCKAELVHLPNFVDLSALAPKYTGEPGSVVYFGRLVEGKGLSTLLEAMRLLPEVTLTVIGDGPARASLEKASGPNVRFAGYKTGKGLYDAVREACAVVYPSEYFENNPRSIIEAFALGKPVVATRIGGIPELVREGETGMLFEPRDVSGCAEKLRRLAGNPELASAMGRRCREFAEKNSGADAHYAGLMAVYGMATMRSRGRR